MADFNRKGGSQLRTGGVFIESVCDTCGKSFLRSCEHAYHRSDNGDKFYCSYSCFRVKDKEDRARDRERLEKHMAFLASRDEKKSEYNHDYYMRKAREKAEAFDAFTRVQECSAKVEAYKQRAELYPTGTYEHAQAMKLLRVWKKKLAQAREVLDGLKAKQEEET